uniref:XPG N-terminal domain-containing protein n=1 Tax=Rhodosorus marinus TaxID=101924 RepID=A0A7S0BSH1_9RHOD|mmetsp:Transcript_6928/g.10218  ORF Transcript_6928/g.10218 Transcript_6928/m.10218 type:complete len:137 (+) Transcript_6928:482-892(+)
MGVTGLLPLLKPICSKTHLENFRRMRVGIDAYSWLHKGAHGCAVDLCTSSPTTGYVSYFSHRLRMLLHYGIVPVVVFDGDRLPMKSNEESERKRFVHWTSCSLWFPPGSFSHLLRQKVSMRECGTAVLKTVEIRLN